MGFVHFYTPEGPLCDPAHDAKYLTLVRDTVTCPRCIAALEERDEWEYRPATESPKAPYQS